MASIPAGALVRFRAGELARLRFPPPNAGVGGIAVHPGALRAPQNRLTLAACVDGAGCLQWVGAVDERMLLPTGARGASLRAAIRERLLVGTRCRQLVRPGLLTAAGVGDPYMTLYAGGRPWVVLGEREDYQLLAAPLNGALANPKWFAPQVAPRHLLFPGAGTAQLELAAPVVAAGNAAEERRGPQATPTPISAGRCSSTMRRSESLFGGPAERIVGMAAAGAASRSRFLAALGWRDLCDPAAGRALRKATGHDPRGPGGIVSSAPAASGRSLPMRRRLDLAPRSGL